MRGTRGIALTIAALLVAMLAAASAQAAGKPRIHVLSNRADMISGGDVLVAIGLPRGAKPSRVRVTVGKRDETGRFAVRANGHFEGLIPRLRVGRNVLRARLGKRVARTTIVNHATGGPVLSGPQVQPWK